MTTPITAETIHQDVLQRLPGTDVTVEAGALIVKPADLVKLCRFLKESEPYRLDYLSNLCGVDYLGDQARVETVYQLYSMEKKHGPVILRLRTENRADKTHLPSLTPVWRGCEFQEREIYDLYGIILDGHPDLRRILMWDGFKDHPMRKDFVGPDDYEYEPTAHEEVLERTKQHLAKETKA